MKKITIPILLFLSLICIAQIGPPSVLPSTGGSGGIATLNGNGTNITVNNQTNIGTVIAPTINGSTAANGDITINGTTSATKTTSYVVFQDAGGNVGIGTASPSLKLEAIGSSGLPNNSGATQVGSLRFGTGGDPVLDFGSDGATGASWIQAENKSALSTQYSLLINPNGGNVGIGTATPATMLDVAQTATSGNIISRTNISATNIITAYAGFASYSSNLSAVATITVGASPSSWTNTTAKNVAVYVDGISVTGTVGINGTAVFGTIGQNTILLQPGEYTTITYTLGTPTATWKPF